MTGQLLTPEQVAERLGMTKEWVWAQVRADRIPHLRLGRYRRFRERRSMSGSRGSSRAGRKYLSFLSGLVLGSQRPIMRGSRARD